MTTNKYFNIKTEIDGVTFDSRKEANRYNELVLLQRSGLIADLELQPRYDLVVNDHKCGFYRGDFRYKDMATGKTVLEDVKHPQTSTTVYRLKKKLVKAIHGIDIVEV